MDDWPPRNFLNIGFIKDPGVWGGALLLVNIADEGGKEDGGIDKQG